jgi:hypothetical protein
VARISLASSEDVEVRRGSDLRPGNYRPLRPYRMRCRALERGNHRQPRPCRLVQMSESVQSEQSQQDGLSRRKPRTGSARIRLVRNQLYHQNAVKSEPASNPAMYALREPSICRCKRASGSRDAVLTGCCKRWSRTAHVDLPRTALGDLVSV